MFIVSEESLEELNSKLDSPVPMNRFRPNIITTGCLPHAEVSRYYFSCVTVMVFKRVNCFNKKRMDGKKSKLGMTVF